MNPSLLPAPAVALIEQYTRGVPHDTTWNNLVRPMRDGAYQFSIFLNNRYSNRLSQSSFFPIYNRRYDETAFSKPLNWDVALEWVKKNGITECSIEGNIEQWQLDKLLQYTRRLKLTHTENTTFNFNNGKTLIHLDFRYSQNSQLILTNLNELRYIDFDYITGVYPDFRTLPKLEKLIIRWFKSTQPPELYNPSLKHLHIVYSDLERLPALHPNLEQLSIIKCSLRETPDLSSMVNLKVLDLSFNQLSEFPRLDGLVDLVSVNLDHNQISVIPDFPLLPSLIRMTIDNNRVLAIPNITNLPNLGHLSLQDNEITEIPPNLDQRISVFGNIHGLFR